MLNIKKTVVVLLMFPFLLIGNKVIGIMLPKETGDAVSTINGEAALMLDMNSGRILQSKNENDKIYPASTTKILTAVLAIENGDLNEVVTVGREAKMKTAGESTAWLVEGQSLTLRELLGGLLLASGNDAARTVAVHIARKMTGNQELEEEEGIRLFVSRMNEKAMALGAVDSHFMNPNGLHHPDHYSTAEDMGLIARHAMKNKEFKEIVSTHSFSDGKVTYQNTNKLLDPASPYFFEGANGIKTGFTDEAGYCLVSSAKRKDKELLAIVFDSSKEDIWKDSIGLLNKGFSLTE